MILNFSICESLAPFTTISQPFLVSDVGYFPHQYVSLPIWVKISPIFIFHFCHQLQDLFNFNVQTFDNSGERKIAETCLWRWLFLFLDQKFLLNNISFFGEDDYSVFLVNNILYICGEYSHCLLNNILFICEGQYSYFLWNTI